MDDRPSPIIQNSKAFIWIVKRTLLISGSAYFLYFAYVLWHYYRVQDPKTRISSMIQTGPQKEALKTVYLAELMGISADRPVSLYQFDVQLAEKKLLASPVIKTASVKIIKPNSLYVDYTVRQPIAWLYDYENVAVDEEGYIFPVAPFFSPKNLPEIYLGLLPFKVDPAQTDLPKGEWNKALSGERMKLALNLLKLLGEAQYKELIDVKRIDVSKAYASSYGEREIVVILEDGALLQHEGKDHFCVFPRTLRLSTKNYAQELGNYLTLREKMLFEECKDVKITSTDIRGQEKIIDMRIPQLAFIEEKK